MKILTIVAKMMNRRLKLILVMRRRVPLTGGEMRVRGFSAAAERVALSGGLGEGGANAVWVLLPLSSAFSVPNGELPQPRVPGHRSSTPPVRDSCA